MEQAQPHGPQNSNEVNTGGSQTLTQNVSSLRIIFIPLHKGRMLKVALFSRKHDSRRENSSNAKTLHASKLGRLSEETPLPRLCSTTANQCSRLKNKQTPDEQWVHAAELAKAKKHHVCCVYPDKNLK